MFRVDEFLPQDIVADDVKCLCEIQRDGNSPFRRLFLIEALGDLVRQGKEHRHGGATLPEAVLRISRIEAFH